MSHTAQTGPILERIIAGRRHAVGLRQRLIPLNALRMTVKRSEPPRDFAAAISRDAINIIAELKKASPSKGLLREDFNSAALARGFAAAGAAALSVLTEEEYFQGDLKNLRIARKAAGVPLLRKDFIFDAWQVWESRAAEADSFLLIAAILDGALLAALIREGRTLGMEPLVEVHTREELRRALDAGARIIGVNNRDLRTFDVRIETSLELIEAIPDDCIAVAESGIDSRDALQRLRNAGFDAFLIGEHFMRAPDPAAALRELAGAP